MRMAVKVVSSMTLATIPRCGSRSIRRAVMTGGTVVMFLIVGTINKRSSNSYIMTTGTFTLQRYLGCMILRRMRRKINRYTAVTLATIACQSLRGIRRTVMTHRTVVVL
jgi:hypothetical protein